MTFVKAAAAAACMALLLWVGKELLPVGRGLARNAWAVVKVVGVGLLGTWLYYWLTKVMAMPETNYVNRALNRRRAGAESEPEIPPAG